MKSKLKLGFTDFIPSLQNFFCSILSTVYDIEIDNNRPDFLFFSTEDFGTENKNFDKSDGPIKILFTGENRRPRNYNCHYAISFDHNWSKWHYRLPLYVIDMWCIKNESKLDYEFDHVINTMPWLDNHPRRNFCGFVHRNPSNPIRNKFFDELRKYKQVTSAGPLYNTTGTCVEGIQGKLDFFKLCKFSLCFENSSYPGYVTEKILHSFYGNTVPIYWGSETIGVDFNEKSFINVGLYKTIDEAINRIKEVDQNDRLYLDMIQSKKMPDGIPNECVNLNSFLNWFEANVYQKKNMRVI